VDEVLHPETVREQGGRQLHQPERAEDDHDADDPHTVVEV
jgi:hypothetical protein